MTWLKTLENRLVNLDNVATVQITNYGDESHYYVVAEAQITESEDYAIAPFLFRGNKWDCSDFIKFLFEKLGEGCRVIDANEFWQLFAESDEVQK